MLTIETSGSWREMGRQLGEQCGDDIRRCMQTYAPWLIEDTDRFRPAVADLRAVLAEHCPELLEESQGMAEGAGLEPDLTLGFRFFAEVRKRLSPACCAIYLANTPDGPLLGRNCDLDPKFDAGVQLCRVCRPSDGPAMIKMGYVGLAGATGLNEHGLGLGGASAHTTENYGNEGLPAAVLGFMVMGRCRTAAQAASLMASHKFLGKSANIMVGDKGGGSVLFELAPGRTPVAVGREDRRQWQACTNFFQSGEIPIAPEQAYLQSAYARYGRLVHQLEGNFVEPSVAGLQDLLAQITQPGLFDTGREGKVKTAYSQVLELKAGVVHYTPGHPAEVAWQSVAL